MNKDWPISTLVPGMLSFSQRNPGGNYSEAPSCNRCIDGRASGASPPQRTRRDGGGGRASVAGILEAIRRERDREMDRPDQGRRGRRRRTMKIDWRVPTPELRPVAP